jgi:predicted acetyltransferase
MGLTLRWVGEDELDRVAETRLLCYGAASGELEQFKTRTHQDGRAKAGDYLLAERDGRCVGTATSLSMSMWVRGSALPCQGVAWVGAIRTERRKAVGNQDKGTGVASAVMRETLRAARERGFVLSALMPFRASYYEHFGYGVVERRNEWTVPLCILPVGDCDGFRVLMPEDRAALADCHARSAQLGQCDIEKSAEEWEYYLREAEGGFVIVDRPEDGGPVRSWMYLVSQNVSGRSIARVQEMAYESPAAFRRQLHFLASLKDQYSAASITVPADFPLNLLLRESQVPHRLVSHPTAEARAYTRMQLRILDHIRLASGLHVAERHRGSAVVAVRESEGHVSRFRLEIADGRASAAISDASADVECPDRIWACIASGELPIARAAELGLAEVRNSKALAALEALADGPVPFCRDYF